jgi:hypothetical protein
MSELTHSEFGYKVRDLATAEYEKTDTVKLSWRKQWLQCLSFRGQAKPPELVYVARSALLLELGSDRRPEQLLLQMKMKQSEKFSLACAKNNV